MFDPEDNPERQAQIERAMLKKLTGHATVYALRLSRRRGQAPLLLPEPRDAAARRLYRKLEREGIKFTTKPHKKG